MAHGILKDPVEYPKTAEKVIPQDSESWNNYAPDFMNWIGITRKRVFLASGIIST